MRNDRKLFKNLFLLSMALLLSIIPYIKASASGYKPVVGEAPAAATLSSRAAASLIDLAPRQVFPVMKPDSAPAITSKTSFTNPVKPSPNPHRPAAAPPATKPEPAVQIPMAKMAAPAVPYKKYVTTAYYLNVRKEASSKAPILRVVAMGDLLNVLSKTENGWLELYEGGFVHSAYAQLAADGAGTVTKTLAPPAPASPETSMPAKSSDIAAPNALTPPVLSTEPAKPTSVVHSDSGLTTAHIGEILEGTALNEPALVSAILEIEDEYGINAYFTIAVMKLESGNGKSKLAKSKNNLFGLNATGGSNAKAYAFDTKADCVRKFGQLIADLYVDKGYTTVEKVAGKYCPANDDWSKLVKKIMYSDHSKLADSNLS